MEQIRSERIRLKKLSPIPVGLKDIRSGLVLDLDFSSIFGTNIPDKSGNLNNGIISGAVISSGIGDLKSLSFDGVDDFVKITGNSTLNIINNITLAAFVNPSLVLGDNRIIFKKSTTYYFQIDDAGTNKLEAYLYGTSSPGYHQTSEGIPLNEWTFVGMTYTSGTLKLYVGKNVYTFSTTGNLANNTNNVSIGSSDVGTERLYVGKIGGISRIYNRVLSDSEMRSLRLFFMKKAGLII